MAAEMGPALQPAGEGGGPPAAGSGVEPVLLGIMQTPGSPGVGGIQAERTMLRMAELGEGLFRRAGGGGSPQIRPRSQDTESATLERRPQVGSEGKSKAGYQPGTWAAPKQQPWGLT